MLFCLTSGCVSFIANCFLVFSNAEEHPAAIRWGGIKEACTYVESQILYISIGLFDMSIIRCRLSKAAIKLVIACKSTPVHWEIN